MPDIPEIKIDVNEEFPHLTRAPAVEAILVINARPEQRLNEPTVSQELKRRLPDYPKSNSQTEVRHQFKLTAGQPAESSTQELGWKGMRISTEDDQQIAQFNVDGFVFSRLMPYEGWQRFQQEATRLWKIYVELAKPAALLNLGVRFVNRLELPVGDGQFEDYIEPYPKPPQRFALPFAGFFHHDSLFVPRTPYVINMIRTVQYSASPSSGIALILDITVSCNISLELHEEALIDKTFAEMRWLKNKAFFGSITQKTLDRIK